MVRLARIGEISPEDIRRGASNLIKLLEKEKIDSIEAWKANAGRTLNLEKGEYVEISNQSKEDKSRLQIDYITSFDYHSISILNVEDVTHFILRVSALVEDYNPFIRDGGFNIGQAIAFRGSDFSIVLEELKRLTNPRVYTEE